MMRYTQMTHTWAGAHAGRDDTGKCGYRSRYWRWRWRHTCGHWDAGRHAILISFRSINKARLEEPQSLTAVTLVTLNICYFPLLLLPQAIVSAMLKPSQWFSASFSPVKQPILWLPQCVCWERESQASWDWLLETWSMAKPGPKCSWSQPCCFHLEEKLDKFREDTFYSQIFRAPERQWEKMREHGHPCFTEEVTCDPSRSNLGSSWAWVPAGCEVPTSLQIARL